MALYDLALYCRIEENKYFGVFLYYSQILWLWWLVSGYQIDGSIHVLLAIALIVVLIRISQGQYLFKFTRISFPRLTSKERYVTPK